MDSDFLKLTESMSQNFNQLMNELEKNLARIPEEERNKTMANNQTITDIKQAVEKQDIDALNKILKQCQSEL
jgi:hypothetical protein